jgi:hypothetical protein
MKIPPNIKIYGDVTYRGQCNSEEIEQIDFFALLREFWPQYAAIAIHPKNEGKRSNYRIKLDRKSGSLNKGASDVIIPASPPLVIELKRRDHTKSKITSEQVDYLTVASDMGAFACIALGAKAALAAVEEWHKLRTETGATK